MVRPPPISTLFPYTTLFRSQKVVEVMRDAGREATHRLHFLRLAELLLEPLALRHVIDHDLLGPPAGERDSVTARLHLDDRPGLLAMPPGAGVVVGARPGHAGSMQARDGLR